MWKSLVTALALLAPTLAAQESWPPDPGGRHIIPHGFVTVTGLGTEFDYTLDEYKRMIPLGANFQVIRIFAGKMGAWPGYTLDPKYVEKLDRMVAFGKQVGLQTAFKMTIYDIKGSAKTPLAGSTIWFNDDDWTDFWQNKDGRQDLMIAAWRKLFEHFKHEPSIAGYDLLNETNKGHLPVDAKTFASGYLVPYYRRLVDTLHQVDPKQWAIFQPPIGGSATPPLERERIVYAPHLYSDVREYARSGGVADPSKYAAALDAWQEQARAAHAAMFIGEYGNPAIIPNEGSIEKQVLHAKGEMGAAAEIDKRALGAIRPWFSGSQSVLRILGPPTTWGLFYGNTAASGPERKYIVDVVARPMPLAIAGRIETFGFDFATRVFTMRFTAGGPSQGESEIFIPRQRHFPDGFRVMLPNGVTAACDGALRLISNERKLDGSLYRWDESRSRLVIHRWDGVPDGAVTLKIVPGLRD